VVVSSRVVQGSEIQVFSSSPESLPLVRP
jgi:hypothetical protein